MILKFSSLIGLLVVLALHILNLSIHDNMKKQLTFFSINQEIFLRFESENILHVQADNCSMCFMARKIVGKPLFIHQARQLNKECDKSTFCKQEAPEAAHDQDEAATQQLQQVADKEPTAQQEAETEQKTEVLEDSENKEGKDKESEEDKQQEAKEEDQLKKEEQEATAGNQELEAVENQEETEEEGEKTEEGESTKEKKKTDEKKKSCKLLFLSKLYFTCSQNKYAYIAIEHRTPFQILSSI